MAKRKYKICGGKKRDGKPCQKPPMVGRERCKLHGGATPIHQNAGNHSAVKHGFYSRRFTDDEMEALKSDEIHIADLEREIDLCRIQLRRVVDVDDRILGGEVQAGMRLSELRRVTKQTVVGANNDGTPVIRNEPTEDHMVRKLPDTQELMLKFTARIQGLVMTLQATHVDRLEALEAKLISRLSEVEDEKRRLQQFGVVQGGKRAG